MLESILPLLKTLQLVHIFISINLNLVLNTRDNGVYYKYLKQYRLDFTIITLANMALLFLLICQRLLYCITSNLFHSRLSTSIISHLFQQFYVYDDAILICDLQQLNNESLEVFETDIQWNSCLSWLSLDGTTIVAKGFDMNLDSWSVFSCSTSTC